MTSLFIATMKVVKVFPQPEGHKPVYGHPYQKIHLIEAESEDDAMVKLKAFYKAKGHYELRHVDIEPTIK